MDQYGQHQFLTAGNLRLVKLLNLSIKKLTRIGEGDRIGDGDDIRLICRSGFILSSTIAVKFEFLFHVQHISI